MSYSITCRIMWFNFKYKALYNKLMNYNTVEEKQDENLSNL